MCCAHQAYQGLTGIEDAARSPRNILGSLSVNSRQIGLGSELSNVTEWKVIGFRGDGSERIEDVIIRVVSTKSQGVNSPTPLNHPEFSVEHRPSRY